MFITRVSFDNTVYNPVELQSAKNDLMNGVSFEALEEMYDVCVAQAAVIECAKEYGWNMDAYIQEYGIEEELCMYFAFGETESEVLCDRLMTAALDYLKEQLCV